jgi:hypothetical protein
MFGITVISSSTGSVRIDKSDNAENIVAVSLDIFPDRATIIPYPMKVMIGDIRRGELPDARRYQLCYHKAKPRRKGKDSSITHNNISNLNFPETFRNFQFILSQLLYFA